MKKCLICDADNAADAETCVECGEGSWPAIDAPAPPPAKDDDAPVQSRRAGRGR